MFSLPRITALILETLVDDFHFPSKSWPSLYMSLCFITASFNSMVFTFFKYMKASHLICQGKRNLSILMYNSYLLYEFFGGRISMEVHAV